MQSSRDSKVHSTSHFYAFIEEGVLCLAAAIRDEEEENRRVEEWIARWDKETILRKQLKYAECQRALSGPTNPAEELLQKEIKARTKKHVKVVLRKAGKLCVICLCGARLMC